MPEEATIKFYHVQKCGYYEDKALTPLFGGLSDTLEQLSAWVHDPDKSLRDTKIFEVDDSSALDPTYCFDILSENDNNSWLLVTWNESHNEGGKIPTVDGDSPVGESNIEVTDIPDGRIPGYPTYFWVLPERNALATVRFGNPKNGHQNLIEYITQFLYKYTCYAVDGGSTGNEDNIAGYSIDPDNEEPKEVTPRFQSSPWRIPGRVEFIRNNREKIRKIIKRNALSWQVPEESNLLLRMLSLVGVGEPPITEGEVKTKYEVPFNPSPEQLDAIISEWEESEGGTRWNDVGFKLARDDEIHWLGYAFCKGSFQLDVNIDEAGIAKPEDLLIALAAKREEILSLLP